MFTAIRDVCPGLFRQCLSPLCLLCCYPLHVLAFFPILTPDLVNSRCPYSLSFINFSSLRYSLSFCRSRYTMGFLMSSFPLPFSCTLGHHFICSVHFVFFGFLDISFPGLYLRRLIWWIKVCSQIACVFLYIG